MIPYSQTVEHYNTFVEEMQGQMNEMLGVMNRVERNLFSIVENEMRFDLRRTMTNLNNNNNNEENNTNDEHNGSNNHENNNSNRFSVLNPNRNLNRPHRNNRVSRIRPYGISSPRFTRNTLENRRDRNVNSQYRTYEYYNPPERLFLRRNLDGTSTLHNTRNVPVNDSQRMQAPPPPSFPLSFMPSLFSNVTVRPTEQQISNATELVRYGSTTNRRQTSCPIGLTPFNNNDEVIRILHCGHIFVPTNLRRWFQSNVRCPLCRYDIREYNPLTAISNPYNTSLRNNRTTNSLDDNQPTESNSPRARSNSADCDLEAQTTLSSRTNSNNDLSVMTNLSPNVNDSSNNLSPETQQLTNELDEIVSNIANELSSSVTNEIATYLRGIIDLSNLNVSDLNDISFNIATVTTFQDNEDNENDDNHDNDDNDENET